MSHWEVLPIVLHYINSYNNSSNEGTFIVRGGMSIAYYFELMDIPFSDDLTSDIDISLIIPSAKFPDLDSYLKYNREEILTFSHLLQYQIQIELQFDTQIDMDKNVITIRDTSGTGIIDITLVDPTDDDSIFMKSILGKFNSYDIFARYINSMKYPFTPLEIEAESTIYSLEIYTNILENNIYEWHNQLNEVYIEQHRLMNILLFGDDVDDDDDDDAIDMIETKLAKLQNMANRLEYQLSQEYIDKLQSKRERLQRKLAGLSKILSNVPKPRVNEIENEISS